ncbi:MULTISPECIES: tyrosine-type recombinase/integrase [unclassified Candidatus Tisiphia]|uniref:tyrosine-type recombinase/integrase n=1 Tax=unclassified Candidatus Tisiphia TaxID=2996318 RepID=UPI0035C922EE
MTTFDLNFTQQAVSKIILSKTKTDFYNDTKEKGLYLIVNTSKTFYLRKTVEKKGRCRAIRLGKFPYMSVAEARNKAAELKRQIARGINPLEKLAIANNQIDNQPAELTNNPIDDKLTKLTVKEFFDKHYIEEHCKRRNRGWENDIARMKRLGKDYYDMKIATVTRADIQKTFNDISNNRGLYSANDFVKLFSAMFNRGIKWEMLEKNPAKDIERNPENVRTRYIATIEELTKFIKTVIAECTSITADAILMLLFTGARRSNVLSMKWQDINFENMTWTIPAKIAKNNKTQRVHLVNSALSILTRRQQENNNKSVWVFPSSHKDSKSGHIAVPQEAWQKICKVAGIDDLRIHDLRRTHGSWMRKAGANREIIGEALGHKDQRSTEVYDIIAKEQVREFQNKAAIPFDKILKDTEFFTENKVALPKETKEITDNVQFNNIIEALQIQIKAQQKMIEELMQQIRDVKYT